MRRQRWIAVMVSLALFLTGILQLGQTKGRAAETRLTIKRDEIGKCSIYGHRSVKKEVLNTKDLGTGRSKMSRNKAAEIPRAYDAREEGLLTEIKDQGALEICWAFAVIGASETDILQKGWEKDSDLSEYHLAYSAYNRAVDPLGLTAEDKVYVKKMSNDIYSWGGNAYLALATLAHWQGEVAEETAPIEQLKKSIEERKTAVLSDELMFEKDCYHLQNAEFVYLTEENRDLIKQKLMQKGAAAISLHMPENEQEQKRYCNTGNNEFTAYYCDNPSLWANHEVLVVGWDDDYAVSNFNSQCRPSKQGAWLLRNSWGDFNELGGYFWLSYEDAMLQIENNEEAEVIFYGVEPADNYDHNYQYDTGDPTSYINGLHSIANVYTAQDYELLQAVSFFTQERDTRYSISVYRNAASDDPSSGTKMGETLTGTISERGYHTIDFSEVGGSDIPLAKGDRFSIVLRLTDLSGEGENVYYTYESCVGMPRMRDIVTAEPGESFWSEEEGTWYDFSDLANDDEVEGANFCLKAFTKVVDESAISTPTPTPTMVPTPTPTPTPTSAIVPTQAPTPTPTMVPTQAPTPTLSPTQVPTYLPTMNPLPSSVPDLKPDSIQTSPTLPVQTQMPGTVKEPDAQSKNGNEKTSVIVKKLAFTPKTKTVRAGKKLKLAKYLKITKSQKGTPKIVYEFTKKKYKKFATLSKKGVLKARKAGRKHTLYVRARARDGSGKTVRIKVKIK